MLLVVLGLMFTQNVEMTSSKSAVINTALTIQSENTCEHGGWEQWNLEAGVSPRRVVTDLQGQCEFGERYLDRAKTRGNKLIIDPVKVGDEGLYIHKCNYGRTWRSPPVKIDPQRSIVEVDYGGSLCIGLYSSDQVKLNFTQRGGSSAPETQFIIDSGQAFCHLVAGRGTHVTVHNDTAVLSNLVQDGSFTVIHGNTDKVLHEVNFTVPRSAHGLTTVTAADKSRPIHWWSTLDQVTLNITKRHSSASGTFVFDTRQPFIVPKETSVSFHAPHESINMVPASDISFSQGQMKLKFALSNSSLPITVCIIDKGQVFCDCTAFGGIGTSVLHNKTMPLNLIPNVKCIIVDSKTETVVSDISCTVTHPDHGMSTADDNISKDHNWFPEWWMIVSLVIFAILLIVAISLGLRWKTLSKHLLHECFYMKPKMTARDQPLPTETRPRSTSSVSLHHNTNV